MCKRCLTFFTQVGPHRNIGLNSRAREREGAAQRLSLGASTTFAVPCARITASCELVSARVCCGSYGELPSSGARAGAGSAGAALPGALSVCSSATNADSLCDGSGLVEAASGTDAGSLETVSSLPFSTWSSDAVGIGSVDSAGCNWIALVETVSRSSVARCLAGSCGTASATANTAAISVPSVA